MKTFRNCIEAIKRRPFIIGFFAIISVFWSYLDQLLYTLYNKFISNAVTTALSYINIFAEGEPESILSEAAPVVESEPIIPSNILLPSIVIFIFGLFAISAIISVFASGYFHVLNISLQPKERVKGEFLTGVLKHYFKYTIYIFLNLLTLCLLVIVVIFASFPALFSLKMVIQGGFNDLVLATIFIALISLFVLFFVVATYLMYTAYMYPALTNYKKGAFYMARKVVNAYYWYLLPRFLCFTTIILAWTVFLVLIDFGTITFAATIVTFILNIFFKIIVLFLFLFFLFISFRIIKNELQSMES